MKLPIRTNLAAAKDAARQEQVSRQPDIERRSDQRAEAWASAMVRCIQGGGEAQNIDALMAARGAPSSMNRLPDSTPASLSSRLLATTSTSWLTQQAACEERSLPSRRNSTLWQSASAALPEPFKAYGEQAGALAERPALHARTCRQVQRPFSMVGVLPGKPTARPHGQRSCRIGNTAASQGAPSRPCCCPPGFMTANPPPSTPTRRNGLRISSIWPMRSRLRATKL